MVIGLVELVVIVGVLALIGWVGWLALGWSRPATTTHGRLLTRDRMWLAEAIAGARWAPAHDEVDGQTRVLLRRSYTGLDGHPVVLEERVLEIFPARDPAWEVRFTEAMANARFRCSYLNTEDAAG